MTMTMMSGPIATAVLVSLGARGGGGSGGGHSGGSSGGGSGGSHFGGGTTYIGVPGNSGYGTSGGSSSSGAGVMIVVAVIALLIGVFVLRRFLRNRNAAPPYAPPFVPPVGPVFDEPYGAPPAGEVMDQAGLPGLIAKDPHFDASVFCDEVRRSFLLVQQNWTNLTPDGNRPIMTETLHSAQAAQIAAYRDAGRRNVLEDVTVDGVVLMHAAIVAAGAPGRDTLTVRITAAMIDYELDAAGKVTRGDKHSHPFREDWNFVRDGNAKTNAVIAAGPRTCTHCGAAAESDTAGRCAFCGHLMVGNDQSRWLLGSIDQLQWT